jgi:flagellar protein FlaG
METKAALTPPIPEPSTPLAPPSMTVPGSPAGGAVVSADKAKPAQADGPQPWDLRLVIEQDDATGTYVYKTVDRRTGETLQQLPREEVLRFRQAEHYDPGEVFDGLT